MKKNIFKSYRAVNRSIINLRTIFTVPLLFCSWMVSGQSIELPKNIQTPDAASLGKYGDVPVSLYTGSPVISIPLHSMNERGVQLDIALNYDASGVRVNDIPGWVGQNWSLSCGGIVTRTVKGACPDEMDWRNAKNSSNAATPGYYYNYNTLNTSNWSTENKLKQIVESVWGSSTLSYLTDLEPDIFTFNFMGMTGKFFLGQDGKWKVQSESNLKVEINMADNVYPMGFEKVGRDIMGWKYPKVIGKIKITDDKGNAYTFGGTQNAIEYTFPDFFNQTYFYSGTGTMDAHAIIANAWYLTEVKDKYGNVLYSLSYTRGAYQANFYLSSGVVDYTKENGDGLDPACYSPTITENGLSVAGQLTAPSYLNEIQSASGERIGLNAYTFGREALKYKFDGFLSTKFWENYGNIPGNQYTGVFQDNFWYVIHSKDGSTQLYTPKGNMTDDFKYVLNQLQWWRLQDINIYQNDSLRNKITFLYNPHPNKRLFLDSMYISQGDRKYKFEYYKKDNMPYFLSDSVDLMGYYRGDKFGNYRYPADFPNHATTRTPDKEYAQYGILKKITYPTGGISAFDYELHDYSQKVCNETTNYKSLITDTGTISGLRIKQIAHNDINGNRMVKKYFYKRSSGSNVSSGILLFEPVFFYPVWKTKTLASATYHEKVFNINPIIPMSNFLGTHIEYSNVMEQTEGNGYTEYKYYNYNDVPDVGYAGTLCINHSPFDSYTGFGFKRGKIKEQSVYNESATLMERKSYQYQSNNNLKVRGFDYTIIQPCRNANTIIAGNAYEIYFSDNLLTQETDERFFNGTSVSTVTRYAYKTDNTQTDNFGDMYPDSVKTDCGTIKEYSVFKYPFDNTSNTMMATLAGKRINPVVSKLIQRNGYGTNTMQNVIETKIEYKNFTINKSSIPMPYEEWSRTGTNSFQKNLTVLNYDSRNGNILSYSKNDELVTNIVWSYKNKYPVAGIDNASFALVNSLINTVESFGDKTTLAQSDVDKLNDLRKQSSLSAAQITTYTYRPLVGLLSITDPRGVKTTYEYDDFTRLKSIYDNEQKLLNRFEYGYDTRAKYFNTGQSQTFTPDNCTSDCIVYKYSYVIPENTYVSLISQADADQQALNDVVKNGQNAANQYGCLKVSGYITNVEGTGTIGGLSVTNPTTVQINMNFNSGANRPWISEFIKIGLVKGNWLPSIDRTSSTHVANYGEWEIKIDTAGNIYAKAVTGTPPQNNVSISITVPFIAN
ncbi:MAG: RHS repeat protein [Candidatus Azobacteroides sp.]|nr:RHS repeat protein [Candidatus Azobacteroides sp.]